MSTQLDRVENDLRQTRHQFHSQFGRFQNFSTPTVLTLREAQRLLKDREALIVMQQLSRHVGFERNLWVQVVTKTATRWIRTSLTHKALRTHVDALRCGLDRSSWDARAEICARHLGIGGPGGQGSRRRQCGQQQQTNIQISPEIPPASDQHQRTGRNHGSQAHQADQQAEKPFIPLQDVPRKDGRKHIKPDDDQRGQKGARE